MSYLLCLCPVPIPLLPVPASPLQASNYLLVLLHNNGPSTRQIYFPWGKEEILRDHQSFTMALSLLLLLLPSPLLASLGFPLTMPYVRPQLPQVGN